MHRMDNVKFSVYNYMSLSTTWFDLNNGHYQVLPLKNTFRKTLVNKHQVENKICVCISVSERLSMLSDT